MSNFQILSRKSFPLKVDNEKENLVFHRYEHRATIGHGCKEYLIFIDHAKAQSHIEEVTGGHLEAIEDDSLHEALTNFAMENGLLALGPPPLRKLA